MPDALWNAGQSTRHACSAANAKGSHPQQGLALTWLQLDVVSVVATIGWYAARMTGVWACDRSWLPLWASWGL